MIWVLTHGRTHQPQCSCQNNECAAPQESAVGFDTAVKVYSQLVGNTAIDGASARKYWYFMRLMGQDPSHIALEVAMQTHPDMVLLAEEVRAKRWSLNDIVREVSDVVQARSEKGKNFGTIVVRKRESERARCN